MENQKEIINSIYEQAKNREIHPCGTFDNAKRWHPCDSLEQYMCGVRFPSRAYPFSYMTHCRTKKFISAMIVSENIDSLEKAIHFYQNGK